MMTDLVLGDEHTIFAETLAGVLTNNSFVVRAVVRNISDLIDSVREHQPALCLVERRFADGDAIDAIGDILQASSGTRVVLLSADADSSAEQRALRSGAQGYLHKSAEFSVLVDAIKRIMVEQACPAGEAGVTGTPDAPGAAGAATAADRADRADRPDRPDRAGAPGPDDGLPEIDVPTQRTGPPSPEATDAHRLAGYLTTRERECLELIVEGLGTDAMAKRLGVSNTTVRTHSQRLLTKLGVHSRLEAASFAVRYSLLERPPRA